jgi:hypothetical protein
VIMAVVIAHVASRAWPLAAALGGKAELPWAVRRSGHELGAEQGAWAARPGVGGTVDREVVPVSCLVAGGLAF